MQRLNFVHSSIVDHSRSGSLWTNQCPSVPLIHRHILIKGWYLTPGLRFENLTSHLLTCNAVTSQFKMNSVELATDRFMHLKAGCQFSNNISKMSSFDTASGRFRATVTGQCDDRIWTI